jgi:hypothetical protein
LERLLFLCLPHLLTHNAECPEVFIHPADFTLQVVFILLAADFIRLVAWAASDQAPLSGLLALQDSDQVLGSGLVLA